MGDWYPGSEPAPWGWFIVLIASGVCVTASIVIMIVNIIYRFIKGE